MGFALIIQIILLLLMLFSALSYLFKRSDNKQNLQQAITNNESTRQLTSEEFELLKPYLDNKSMVKPYKYQSSLVSRDVSVITGSCVRRSLSTNSSESSYYFMIGDIEVFFPYSMQNFTMNANVAEVVFTERYAFVVSLNGFSLIDAKDNIDLKSQLDEKWQNGDHGQFKIIIDDNTGNELSQNNHNEIESIRDIAKKSRCEILEQRDETLFEQAAKNKANTGFLAAVFGVIAATLALSYDGSDGMGWLIISGISFIVALILYFHKLSKPIRKVNRVKGTITSKNKANHTLLIGDNLQVHYLEHWESMLPDHTSYDVDVSVVVDSKELVLFEHSLSVDKEIEQYGPGKFWGKHCFLFIVGLALLVFIMLSSASLTDDMIFSSKWIRNQTVTWSIDDEFSLKSNKIAQGDWLNLDLYGASCNASLYSKQCKTVYINPTKVDLQNIIRPLPQWIEDLANDSLVIMQRDEQVEMIENFYNKLNGNSNSSNNYYDSYYANQNRNTYTRLLNINSLVLAADQACQSQSLHCSNLKEILTAIVTDKNKQKLDDWPAIVHYVSERPTINVILDEKVGMAIERLFHYISDNIFETQKSLLLKQLTILQQSDDSIGLHFTDNGYTEVYLDNVDRNKSKSYGNASTVNYYSEILSTGKGHVKMKGLVNNITYRDDGKIKRLDINDNNRYCLDDNVLIPGAVITALTFFIVVLITALQGICWVRKVRFNKRRLNRMLSDYNQHIL